VPVFDLNDWQLIATDHGGESAQERRGVANRLEESDVRTAPSCALLKHFPVFALRRWTLGIVAGESLRDPKHQIELGNSICCTSSKFLHHHPNNLTKK
jgi:hypothetical protein